MIITLLLTLIQWLIPIIFFLSLVLAVLVLICKFLGFFKRPFNVEANTIVLGIFHPYCHQSGGGERVLWCAIRALVDCLDRIKKQHKGVKIHVFIYTGDVDISGKEILSRAQERFGITGLTDQNRVKIDFIYIRSRTLLEAKWYPRLTLVGQALGSILVAIECLFLALPDIWLDTTGAAFAYPVARFLGVPIIATYTHYPMISSDMLQAVAERRPGYNNAALIAQSFTLTYFKLMYYKFVAWLYGCAGRESTLTIVNSSWTKAHIDNVWGLATKTIEKEVQVQNKQKQNSRKRSASLSSSKRRDSNLLTESLLLQSDHVIHHHSNSNLTKYPESVVVYPPCNTVDLESLPLTGRLRRVISIAQFRPEKDHPLQLRAFAAFKRSDETAFSDVILQLVGGVRDEGDKARVDSLKALATELGIANSVEFHVNLPYPKLRAMLGQATCSLHTMWNEHFGIVVVESMAAGCVTIAHRSGGPLSDIIKHGETGFLASTDQEYAQALINIFTSRKSSKADIEAIAKRGRIESRRFSEEIFQQDFSLHFSPLLELSLQTQR
jgi:alpha-1,2-mannosyltransferase